MRTNIRHRRGEEPVYQHSHLNVGEFVARLDCCFAGKGLRHVITGVELHSVLVVFEFIEDVLKNAPLGSRLDLGGDSLEEHRVLSERLQVEPDSLEVRNKVFRKGEIA